MSLYTDGTTEATRQQAVDYIAALDAATNLAEREASRDEVQAFIDNDVTLATQNITVLTDAIDPMQVILSFPADAPGAPKFWLGVLMQIIEIYHGQAVEGEPYQVRARKDRAMSHLSYITPLL